jgi:DNA primase
MARYTQESIEAVRESIDMVALVSRKTDLRRVGSRYTGLCPFHDERTPSFSVDPEKRLYHCFGCGQGGDAIGFVMETEGLPFPEAVEALADEARVELKRDREDPREEERRRRRERLLKLLDRTAGFYATYLWESAEAARARDYLLGRGLGEDVLRAFRVGYAPKAWDRVLIGARRDGFTPDELLAAGLAQRSRSSGGVMDRFRERITFPLADARGRVLGFGARAMRDEQGAKYINTSEGELYHKGRQLFGIDRARAAVAKERRVVVVEGYTDVLALHAAGIEESVGIMGTAFTQEQLGELARAVGEEGTIVLALDADRSGQQAMLRAAKMAEERDIELRVVQMPEGTDPAELVAGGKGDAFRERLGGALSVLEFEVGRVLADADLETHEGRDRALVAARELIGRAPARSATRDHLVEVVADRLDVEPAYVVAFDSRPTTAPSAPAVSGQATLGPEEHFMALCMAAGPAGRAALERLAPEHLPTALLRRVREHLLAGFDDPLAGLSKDDAELAGVVAGIALRADDAGPAGEDALRMSRLGIDLRRLDREVRRARADGQLERMNELASEKQRVKSQMNDAMGQAT